MSVKVLLPVALKLLETLAGLTATKVDDSLVVWLKIVAADENLIDYLDSVLNHRDVQVLKDGARDAAIVQKLTELNPAALGNLEKSGKKDAFLKMLPTLVRFFLTLAGGRK